MKILKWKPLNKGALLGFADVEVTAWNGLQIMGIGIFSSGEHGRWINLPAKQSEKVNDKGKYDYYPHMKFKDSGSKEIFQDKVLEALDEFLVNEAPPKPPKPSDDEEVPF